MTQFARPDADQATGSWTTTPLWSKVDEGSPGGADSIQSDDNTAGDTADLRLSDVTDPAVSTDHVLVVVWNKSATGGHAINATIELWQGVPGTGTQIDTNTVTGIGNTPIQSEFTLTGGEADSITDYTDLYIRLVRGGDTGGPPGDRRNLVVHWCELRVPDAGASNFFQTVAATAIGTAALSKKTATTLAVTEAATAALSKKTGTTLAASAVGSATLTASLSFMQTLAATATGVAALARKTAKQIAATAAVTASLTRKTATTLAVVATVPAALTKATATALAATATGNATLGAQIVIKTTLAATATGVATLTKKAGKIIGATAVAPATLARKTGKTLAATAAGVAALQKKTATTLSVQAIGSAALAAGTVIRQTLAAVATASPTLNTATTYRQTLAAVDVVAAGLSTVFIDGGGSPSPPATTAKGRQRIFIGLGIQI